MLNVAILVSQNNLLFKELFKLQKVFNYKIKAIITDNNTSNVIDYSKKQLIDNYIIEPNKDNTIKLTELIDKLNINFIGQEINEE